jgi:potassium-transporting ATPase KdpC subunit
MKNHLRANLLLAVATLLIGAILYPLAVLAVGQTLFPTSANGSLVAGPDGSPVGSRLIAQEFKGDEWFQPRPSAVGYNAAGSGGSNLGANNPKLRERVEEQLKGLPTSAPVPADAVTTSGSGLDPHITLRNARLQLERIVAARSLKTDADPTQVRSTIEAILDRAQFQPLAGILGSEPLVNVLEVNHEMIRQLPAK